MAKSTESPAPHRPEPAMEGVGMMGMAKGNPIPRNPYKLDNGLMYCEWCQCTYSRSGWGSGYNTNERGSTMPPAYSLIATIPDDVCPRCRRKETP